MENSSTVLILGDSTSMSVGMEQKMHPFLIAKLKRWPENCKIVNSSLPGMTAADSAAFYFRHKVDLLTNLKGVLIYLGNCDTTSTEVRKGKYTKRDKLYGSLREKMGKIPKKTSIKNRLLHFEWNNSFNPEIEAPEDADDFEYNIDRIIRNCKASGIPVVLVRPKANLYFPAGIGKGNFVFYRYLGINDKISDRITIPDMRFKEALSLHELRKYVEAAELYKKILVEVPTTPMSQEYSLLVTNNYAVAMAESGDFAEASCVFSFLLKERTVRKEIVLYNLAQIERSQGQSTKYLDLLNQSFEEDSSLYRVRSPYISAVDRLKGKYPSVTMLDMATLIPDNLYLDHCHPLPEGQSILAQNIAKAFEDAGVVGKSVARIENQMYNPEFSNGNISEFHDYFKSFAPFSKEEIKSEMMELGKIFSDGKPYSSSMSELSSVSRELKTAVDYYLKHPIFVSIQDVLHHSPVHPSDIGRFPEFYLIRHLIPYMRIHESDSNLSEKFDFELLRKSEQMVAVLPERSIALVENELPEMDSSYEEQRLPRILDKVRNVLIKHLEEGNQVYNRTKTTIFWYVRETLRFGSHSRYSMRYDRLTLEFLAEGLAVAGIINNTLKLNKSSVIDELIGFLNETVKIHEEHCKQFSLNEDSSQLLQDYDFQLSKLLSSIKTQEN